MLVKRKSYNAKTGEEKVEDVEIELPPDPPPQKTRDEKLAERLGSVNSLVELKAALIDWATGNL